MRTRLDNTKTQKGKILEHHLEAEFLIPDGIQRIVLDHLRFVLRAIDRYTDQLDLDVCAGDKVCN